MKLTDFHVNIDFYVPYRTMFVLSPASGRWISLFGDTYDLGTSSVWPYPFNEELDLR